MSNTNPLSGFFRSPKLFTKLPSMCNFYDDSVVDIPDSGEFPVFSMTAKDEMLMKNPDALLNGEAVAQVIASCVPNVKQPRKMISNDIDALLIAIQGATYGDDVEVEASCTKCKETVSGTASIEASLESMSVLEKSYSFETRNGLTIEVRPFSYESTVKAGIANFQSTRSLQSLQNIQDDLEQLRAFNENFVKIAMLNFELIVDSVASVRGKDAQGEDFVVTDRKNIQEFLENCENTVGKQIESMITEVNEIGVNKTIQLQCGSCENVFEHTINFDPVNFFTAS